MDVILSLSVSEKAVLIDIVTKSLPEESIRERDTLSLIRSRKTTNHRTQEERLALLDELSGAWEDTPDDLAEQIMNARTVSDREINLDD